MGLHAYTIHLEPVQEGGFVVRVPSLPAIVTEGDTCEEALAMARDAIQLDKDITSSESIFLDSQVRAKTS